MPVLEHLAPGSAVVGVRWHAPSENYIAEVGYHLVTEIHPDGHVVTRRVRTTHYLGGRYSRQEAEAKFSAVKSDWQRCVEGQRQAYDGENARRRSQGLPPLARFKPVWPKTTVRPPRRKPEAKPTASSESPAGCRGGAPAPSAAVAMPTSGTALGLTIRQARERLRR